MTKKCVLIDGSSYLFRAYHALPPLTNSKGMPTGAVYGVVNMIKKLLAAEKPDYVACVFDTKSKNFRHEIFPEYKANRPEMPQELSCQIAPLHQIIKALGIPLLAIEGLEADDVLGTLAHQASEKQIETVISTGDKDLAQLINAHVTLINTMSGQRLDETTVVDKFGVKADQIIDYLTLMGDSVDNIPGVPGVGPKTAVKWLTQYGSLANLIANQNQITGKVGDNFRAQIPTIALTQELVTVKCDLSLPFVIDELMLMPQQNDELRDLFTQLEFKTWLKEFSASAPATNFEGKGQYETILTAAQWQSFLTLLTQAKTFAIDTETTSLNPMMAKLVGISIAIEPLKAIYVPVGHAYIDCPQQLPLEAILNDLKPYLESKAVGKIGQNCKYDMHIFARYGIHVQNWSDDTMLKSYVLNSVATRHDMDSLAQHYLQYETIPYEAVAGKGAKQITFDQVPLEQAATYAAEDADITCRLNVVLGERIAQHEALGKVYHEIEMPLIDVLWQMEEYGILVDGDKLMRQSQELEKTLQGIESQAYILAGAEFNLASPKQLQEILYDKLQLPVLEKTPKGAPSTAESALQELSHDYELPKLILQHRTLAKLKSTYTDKLPLQINPNTGRVHTSYHQAVAATGRLSSSDPNLQNIPIRTEEGRKIRQAFIAKPGYSILSADYSQIELRIMAHLSQDKGLLKAFALGEDIHRFTAHEIFNVPLEQVTSEQRRQAKAINFGLIYGMSEFGLARQLDISRDDAKTYMAQYFHRYPGVKIYMDAIRKKASESGYVETLFGRRLYLPEINSKNGMRKKAAERTAINAPMQGTAADLIKKAMIALHEKLHQHSDIRLLMQVHDELVLEVKDDVLDIARVFVTDCMQNTVQLSVPLVIDVGVGKNWDEAH